MTVLDPSSYRNGKFLALIALCALGHIYSYPQSPLSSNVIVSVKSIITEVMSFLSDRMPNGFDFRLGSKSFQK